LNAGTAKVLSGPVGYLVVGGVIIFALYVLYQKLKAGATAGAAAVGTAFSNTSSGLADAAQSVLGTGIAAPGGTYTVTMADGSVQTVPYGQLPVNAAPLGAAIGGTAGQNASLPVNFGLTPQGFSTGY
jgi:hypothetical protein